MNDYYRFKAQSLKTNISRFKIVKTPINFLEVHRNRCYIKAIFYDFSDIGLYKS